MVQGLPVFIWSNLNFYIKFIDHRISILNSVSVNIDFLKVYIGGNFQVVRMGDCLVALNIPGARVGLLRQLILLNLIKYGKHW